jgi:uncharacterized protein
MNEQQKTEVEAAVFRRLVDHLKTHDDVQNIDLMILADFCRNCLSKWYVTAAEERGYEADFDAARELVHGMPYKDWKANQPAASAEQMAAYNGKQASKS